jgi:predicted O-methyltransferase YrrM
MFELLKYPKLFPAFKVRSHLTFKERVQLYKLSRNLKWIAEIGSYVGASSCCFGVAVKEYQLGKIICIDTWKNDAMTEGEMETRLEFDKNTMNFREFIVPICGFSTDVVDQVKSYTSYLDLLFIDGDHSYEGVKADWDSYKSLLRVGSIVVFHDFQWAKGVQKVINEDVLPFVESSDSLPNLWWGKIGSEL